MSVKMGAHDCAALHAKDWIQTCLPNKLETVGKYIKSVPTSIFFWLKWQKKLEICTLHFFQFFCNFYLGVDPIPCTFFFQQWPLQPAIELVLLGHLVVACRKRYCNTVQLNMPKCSDNRSMLLTTFDIDTLWWVSSQFLFSVHWWIQYIPLGFPLQVTLPCVMCPWCWWLSTAYVVHDIALFPKYYDPIYHPHCHPELFNTPMAVKEWLEDALNSHVSVCHGCSSKGLNSSIKFSVQWWDSYFVVCSYLNGRIKQCTVTLNNIESHIFTHCHLFSQLYGKCFPQKLSTAPPLESTGIFDIIANEELTWLFCSNTLYHLHLSPLLASVLAMTVKSCLQPGSQQYHVKRQCISWKLLTTFSLNAGDTFCHAELSLQPLLKMMSALSLSTWNICMAKILLHCFMRHLLWSTPSWIKSLFIQKSPQDCW